MKRKPFKGWRDNGYDGKEEYVLSLCNAANVQDLTLLTMTPWVRVWRHPQFDDTYRFTIENCTCFTSDCIHHERENRTIGFLTLEDAKRAAIEEFKLMEAARRRAVDDALAAL